MGVMSCNSTSDKISNLLQSINQNLFRSCGSKDELMIEVDRMHREQGPEFDEFYD